jgi:hypothetical protein
MTRAGTQGHNRDGAVAFPVGRQAERSQGMTNKLAMVVLLLVGGALCVGSFMAWEWFGFTSAIEARTATYGMLAGGPVTLVVGLFSVVAAIRLLRKGTSIGWTVACVCLLGVSLVLTTRTVVNIDRPTKAIFPNSVGIGLVVCLIASVVGVAASIFLLIAEATAPRPEVSTESST